MKRNLFLSLVALSFQSMMAIDFSYSTSRTVDQNISKVKDILLDYDNTCDTCIYNAPNLKEMSILERNKDGNPTLTWERIGGIRFIVKETTAIRKVEVTETPDKVVINSCYPSESEIPQLEEQYGVYHSSYFDTFCVNWTLNKVGDDKTSVEYKLDASSNSSLLYTFSSRTQSEIEQGVEVLMNNLEGDGNEE